MAAVPWAVMPAKLYKQLRTPLPLCRRPSTNLALARPDSAGLLTRGLSTFRIESSRVSPLVGAERGAEEGVPVNFEMARYAGTSLKVALTPKMATQSAGPDGLCHSKTALTSVLRPPITRRCF